MIDDILEFNKKFVESKGYEKYITNKYPDKKIAILSCMDTRLTELIDMWKAEKKFTDFINYDVVETYKDFGGIRNEEDYLITETGARRLGKKIPLTPEEVEALR